MAPGKGRHWFPRGASPVVFARRWLAIRHRSTFTPAGLASSTGVAWDTARAAIAAGPLLYVAPALPVAAGLVPWKIPPVAKFLATHLNIEGAGEWHRATWWRLANRLGCSRSTIGRTLGLLETAGLVEQVTTGRRGFVLLVSRRVSMVTPAESQKRYRGSLNGDTRGVSTVIPEETESPDVQSPPSGNGLVVSLAVDLAHPPTWAQNHPGGLEGTLWAILGSSRTRSQLPAAGPVPEHQIRDLVKLAGVELRTKALARALHRKGLTGDEIVERLKKAGSKSQVRDRAAYFRSLLEDYLAPE